MARWRAGRRPATPFKPIGGGTASTRAGRSMAGILRSASGSKTPHASLNVSRSSFDTRSVRTLPSDEKFSRMTATTRLSMTIDAITMKEMKNANAPAEPQLRSAAEHFPVDSSTAASIIMPLQLSPVRAWKRRSIDEPSVLKLRSAVRFSCTATYVKRLTPRTAYMKTTRASTPPTLTSAGKESTSVMMRSRTCFAPGPLSSRRMRRMRRTRSTRSTIGGMGRIFSRSSAANWSSSEVHTSVQSKRHQLSPK